ncbi:hypothetical protein ACFL2A_03540 [Thermodesulfobacteriota bacterium]
MKFFKVLSILIIALFLLMGCKEEGASTSAPAAPSTPTPMASSSDSAADVGASHTKPKVAAPVTAGSVTKAEGGQTVEDLFTKKAELAGKEVSVHGKVVKYSGGIMGANWVHIQDGSGNGAEGTNDLTVTTQGTATVDTMVTVSGVLTADKDFGSGYAYSVIIENATITPDK